MIANVVFAYIAGSFAFATIHLVREGGRFTDDIVAGFPESHPPTDGDILASVVVSVAMTILLSPILVPFQVALDAHAASIHARKGGGK